MSIYSFGIKAGANPKTNFCFVLTGPKFIFSEALYHRKLDNEISSLSHKEIFVSFTPHTAM